jgi:carboxypeptidase family protein/TonB-dependent receptor-like protein
MVGERLVRYASVLLLVGLFMVAGLPAFAQTITGDISGEVTDSTGALLPNVTVTAVNTGTNFSRSATTSDTGNYRMPSLPIGQYKITATAEGFKTAVLNAEVRAGAIAQANFKMAVGQRSETVEVTGSAPLVELSPNENNYVDNLKIENVPINGRDFNSLLAITPGVQRDPGGGFLAISINGSRTTSNNYFIDGMYNNDRYYGDSAINETGVLGIPAVSFPPEAIEELSVQETPSSEFGVKGGAPILLSMKSGTNSWHGSATWVNHNGLGDADNYFANHNSDNCQGAGECKPTPIHNNQVNGTVGGPIIKDKAFFFLFYETQHNKSEGIKSRSVPTPLEIQAAQQDISANGLTIDPVGQRLLNYFPTSPSGIFTQTTPSSASNNEFGVKFDYKLTQNHSLSFRYIFGDSFQSSPPFAGLPPAPGLPQDLFNSVAPSRAQMAGVSETWNIGNNKILESRLGYTRFAQLLGIGNHIDPESLGIDTGPLAPLDFGVPYVYMYHLAYGGYVGGVQGYPLITRPDATWDWSEHFSWVKGNHTIKLGGNFQRAYTNSIRNEARTAMTLGYFTSYAGYPPSVLASCSSGATPCDPSPTPNVAADVEQLLLGKADLADRSFGDTHRHIYQNSVGFYAQDDWKIKPRLTLSYGLRYEINGTMRDTANKEANFFPNTGFVQVGQAGTNGITNVDYHDVGPHVGFAWDIFGKGKIALRGGYSLSYDVPNFGAFASPYTFAHARTGVFTQANLGFFNVSNSSDVGAGNSASSPLPTAAGASCYDPNASPKAGDYICFDSALAGPLFGTSPTGTPPFNAFSVVKNFRTPRYHNFNVSIQDELFQNNVLTVAYSGQRGKDLLIYYDLNASPIGSPCTSDSACDPFRPLSGVLLSSVLDPSTGNPLPLVRHVIQATNAGYSQYDSMQVSYNQRNWHGLDTQYNLTWSKCFDLNSVNRGGQGDYPQANNTNPLGSTALATPNFHDGWGLCDHDRRLNFNVGGVYSLPTLRRLGQRLGGGWQLSTIYTALAGKPLSVFKNGGSDPSGQGLAGTSIRDAYDGTPLHYNTRNPDNYVVETFTAPGQPDPCGTVKANGGLPLSPFYTPCAGTIGNSRRNILKGPGLSQWDMALTKNTKINEKLSFELRWEVYNVLNRANFSQSSFNNTGGSASFGTMNQTPDVSAGNPVIAQGGPRNMNYTLKFIF